MINSGPRFHHYGTPILDRNSFRVLAILVNGLNRYHWASLTVKFSAGKIKAIPILLRLPFPWLFLAGYAAVVTIIGVVFYVAAILITVISP